jgi:DinB superfamily
MVETANRSRPQPTEYGPFHVNYVALAPEEDIVEALGTQLEEALKLLRGLPEATANTRHPPYTWSVKQVIGHLTDAEREFGHRAFRFARNDPTPLPGFEENIYVANAPFDACLCKDLLAEFEWVRRANVALFRQLPEAAWSRFGVANATRVSVRALAYILVGHARHHLTILGKRLAQAEPS